MQLDVSDIAKIATAFVSLGGGIAFFKPFATQFFAWWLERLRARAAIEDARETTLERIAVSHERSVGVLESFNMRLERMDARLDRIEAHHGISLTPSAVPQPTAPIAPRRQLTDPGGAVHPESTIPPVSAPAR